MTQPGDFLRRLFATAVAAADPADCVRRHLSGIKGGRLAAACHPASGGGESIKPGDPRIGTPDVRMVATPLMALEAAAELARCQGVIPCILGDAIEGEGREDGRGGRNVGFPPALGAALDGHPGIHAVAGDTDGVDGLEEIAGAVPSPEPPACAAAFGLSLAESLARNDGHGFFEALDDGVITGPTLTNVNDFRALLIA